MTTLNATFENRNDGYLWAMQPGKPDVKVATAMRPVIVYSDAERLQFGACIEAMPTDRPSFRFRLEARQLFVQHNVAPLEQACSYLELEVFHPRYLAMFLQGNLPKVEATVISDLRFNGFEKCNERFRQAYEEWQKAA